MELFGNDFGDDLFEEFTKKLPAVVKSTPNWIAHMCEPEWFLQDEITRPFQTDASLINKKHSQANYLYYSGKFADSSLIFDEVINLSLPGNHLLRRELYEGLARSLMKSGNLNAALDAASQYGLNCKSKLHLTAYHSLNSDIYHSSMDYSNELKHLQQAIMFHPLNSDLWFKVAKCYYLLGKPTDSTPIKLSMHKNSSWFYAGSLIRFEIIIKSLAIGGGRVDTFTKKRGQKLLVDEVRPFIDSLPQGFKEKTYEALSRDVYKLEQLKEKKGFIDLGSSSVTKKDTNEDDLSVGNLQTNEYQPNRFEDYWFSFLSSIKDEDLLYNCQNNLH